MFEFQRSSRRLYTTELKVIRNKSFLKRIQCCNILQSSAQSEAQLKLSLSSIFAVRPESAIRNPESGIRHPESGIRHPEKYNFQSYNSPSYNPSDSASTQQPAAPAKADLQLYFQLFPNPTTTTTTSPTPPRKVFKASNFSLAPPPPPPPPHQQVRKVFKAQVQAPASRF